MCHPYRTAGTTSTRQGMFNICLGLGLECQSFDLGNACLAFVNAMDVAATMIERGAIKNAIIVNI